MAKTSSTIIEAQEETLYTYKERSALFGVFKWFEKVGKEQLGVDLVITTQQQIRKVYLNGKEL